MSEALMSAIASRTSVNFDARCRALEEIMYLANFADDQRIRAGATKHLQEVEGVAIITDATPCLVLATSDGVRVEPAAPEIPTTRERASGANVVPFRR